MKAFALFVWAAAAAVALSGSLHSENAAAKSPLEALQQAKEKNAALIGKQTATLEKLDEVAKEAQQLKFLGKRS